MSKPNRAPTLAWVLRRNDPFGSYVQTGEGDTVDVVMPRDPGSAHGTRIVMDRPTARLLAKRINECLDETRKR